TSAFIALRHQSRSSHRHDSDSDIARPPAVLRITTKRTSRGLAHRPFFSQIALELLHKPVPGFRVGWYLGGNVFQVGEQSLGTGIAIFGSRRYEPIHYHLQRFRERFLFAPFSNLLYRQKTSCEPL